MENEDRPILVPIGPPGGRETSRVAILVALAIAVAILKPWNMLGVATPAPSAAPSTPTRAPVTPRPSTGMIELGLDLESEQCFVGAAWRLFTVEKNFGRRMRSWIGLEPLVSASRPDPADLPTAMLLTERLDALGLCTAFRVEPRMTSVEGWRIGDDGTWSPLELSPAVSLTQPDAAVGAVYGPPPDAGNAATGWRAGAYVFKVSEASGDPHWFAVGLRLVPEDAGPSGPPGRSPRPTPAGT